MLLSGRLRSAITSRRRSSERLEQRAEHDGPVLAHPDDPLLGVEQVLVDFPGRRMDTLPAYVPRVRRH